MKKFLIFLVAIVAVVCFGLTIFYFVRNDEVINFTTKEVYCNVGDIITKDELGLKVKKRNKKTKFNYNANEEIGNLVSYDEEHGYYIVNKEVGGDVTVEITTTNKKFPKFEIVFHIGDGKTVATAYNISDEDDLQKIGNKEAGKASYDVAGKYVLRNDINLSNAFTPIETFKGEFYGNGHTISNLSITSNREYAALFGEVSNATIVDLKLKDVNIAGEFKYAAALAGKVSGSTISCVTVEGGNIGSTAENSIVGGLIGEMNSAIKATSLSVEDLTLTGDYTVGGLIGKMSKSTLQATFAKAKIVKASENEDSQKLGGLIGEFEISAKEGSIQQSYAVAESAYAKFGTFIGTISKIAGFAETTENKLAYLVGNYTVGAANKEVASKPDDLFDTFFNEGEKIHFITNETTETELAALSNYIFFAIGNDVTNWSDAAWDIRNNNILPSLRLVRDVEGVPAKYLNRTDVENNVVGNKDSDEQTNRNALADLLNGEITKGFSLAENTTYNMAGAGAFEVESIKDISILGNGAIIKDLTIKGNLFKLVDNCSIENITFENLHTEGNETASLFGEVTSTSTTVSSIENVKVVYAGEISNPAYSFGGIVNTLRNGSKVTGCQVEINVNATYAEDVESVLAGLVAYNRGGFVDKCTVNATLAGGRKIAGLAYLNEGTISNSNATIVVKTNNASDVAGAVVQNSENATISNNTINLSVDVVDGTKEGANIAGLVVTNNGKVVDNNTVSGAGIKFIDVANINSLNVAGIATSNLGNGSIEEAYNTMAQIGNYEISDTTTIAGKNINVAGIVVTNANQGKISQVVSTSNLAGNTVAGVAVYTDNAAVIDQVLIGYNNHNGARNTIAGDKYVAGVVYSMAGNSVISNIQTRSTLDAKVDSSISSLVALIFPDGTTIRNAMIDNEAIGFGTLYKETWVDFGDSANTNELKVKASYNLLTVDGASGSFISVVINTEHIGNGFAAVKQSYYNWSTFIVYCAIDYDSGNYFAYVNDADFAKSFAGECTMTADGSNGNKFGGDNSARWYGWKYNNQYTWNFNNSNEANVWAMGNGTTLNFVNGAYTGAQA